jgi:hypothetical protein
VRLILLLQVEKKILALPNYEEAVILTTIAVTVVNINGRMLSNLKFADDIVIFAKSTTELQEKMTELNTRSKEMDLLMNPTKTKIMTNSMETPIITDGTPIQHCKEYNYLGQATSLTGKREKELQRRISLAWGKIWSVRFVLLDKSINIKLRLEAIQTCVIPVLIYGSQTWTFTKRQTQAIQICQRIMERKVLGINLKDRMRNEELRRRSGIVDAAKAARRGKWR